MLLVMRIKPYHPDRGSSHRPRQIGRVDRPSTTTAASIAPVLITLMIVPSVTWTAHPQCTSDAVHHAADNRTPGLVVLIALVPLPLPLSLTLTLILMLTLILVVTMVVIAGPITHPPDRSRQNVLVRQVVHVHIQIQTHIPIHTHTHAHVPSHIHIAIHSHVPAHVHVVHIVHIERQAVRIVEIEVKVVRVEIVQVPEVSQGIGIEVVQGIEVELEREREG